MTGPNEVGLLRRVWSRKRARARAYGRIFVYYRRYYNREINDEELAEFNELMGRRAWEIREAFIKTLNR